MSHFARTAFLLCLAVFTSPAWASEVTASLTCKILWAGAEEPIELRSRESCIDGCKLENNGPDGLSFKGENTSASQVKLTISSLMSNERLIFVKEFEYEKILGTCGDAQIDKYGANGFCSLCVTER